MFLLLLNRPTPATRLPPPIASLLINNLHHFLHNILLPTSPFPNYLKQLSFTSTQINHISIPDNPLPSINLLTQHALIHPPHPTPPQLHRRHEQHQPHPKVHPALHRNLRRPSPRDVDWRPVRDGVRGVIGYRIDRNPMANLQGFATDFVSRLRDRERDTLVHWQGCTRSFITTSQDDARSLDSAVWTEEGQTTDTR